MIQPFVSVVKNNDIELAIETVLDQLKLPDLNGKKILLKPNVGREVDPFLAINTNPHVVECIYKYLKKKYQAEFYIGDSPIINTTSRKAFQQSGFTDLINLSGLTFLDFDAIPPITLTIPEGKIIKEIKVTGYWPKFDYIISIPVLKMHMHTGASLSFKNCKGLVYKREKIRLHHLEATYLIEPLKRFLPKVKELDLAIADLAYVIKPNLAIIDATFALEGMGPSSGSPKKLDLVIASTDFLAADIVALYLTQPSWSIENVPHLRLIAERRNPQGPFSIRDIDTNPKDLTKLQTKLEEPPTSISIKYPNVNVIDIESCSACLSTLSVFLQHNKQFIEAHFSPEKPLNLAIGKGLKNVDLYEPIFLIGNCTACRQNEGIFIKGCVPVESVIRQTIEEYLKKEENFK